MDWIGGWAIAPREARWIGYPNIHQPSTNTLPMPHPAPFSPPYTHLDDDADGVVVLPRAVQRHGQFDGHGLGGHPLRDAL